MAKTLAQGPPEVIRVCVGQMYIISKVLYL